MFHSWEESVEIIFGVYVYAVCACGVYVCCGCVLVCVHVCVCCLYVRVFIQYVCGVCMYAVFVAFVSVWMFGVWCVCVCVFIQYWCVGTCVYVCRPSHILVWWQKECEAWRDRAYRACRLSPSHSRAWLHSAVNRAGSVAKPVSGSTQSTHYAGITWSTSLWTDFSFWSTCICTHHTCLSDYNEGNVDKS